MEMPNLPAPTPEQVEIVARVARAGGPPHTAAAAAGLPPRRLEQWLEEGRALLEEEAVGLDSRQSLLADLARRLRREVADTEARCLETVRAAALQGETTLDAVRVVDETGAVVKETASTKQGAPQWKAAVWWLEHVLPGQWGDASQAEGQAEDRASPVVLRIAGEDQADDDLHRHGDDREGRPA